MKALLFDVYGTLVDVTTDEGPHARLWQGLFPGAPVEPHRLRELYLERCARRAERVGGLHPDFDLRPVLADLARLLGLAVESVDDLARRFRALSRHGLFARDGAAEALAEGRRRGLRLGVVSNAQAVFTDDELARTGLAGRFDAVVYSSDVEAQKPDAKPFRVCLERLGVEPDEAVYVGNDPVCDVPTPSVLGMRTIFLGEWRHGGDKPDVVIRDASLRHLPAALDQIDELDRLLPR